MRAAIVLVTLAALLGPSLAARAGEPYPILVDWTEGHAIAPTSPFVGSPLAEPLAFTVDACHRMLLLDILYEPEDLTLVAPGIGSLAVLYEFRAEVWQGDTLVLAKKIVRSDFGQAIGLVPEAGEHTLRLSLAWGADVHYAARLRGSFLSNDPTCNPPL